MRVTGLLAGVASTALGASTVSVDAAPVNFGGHAYDFVSDRLITWPDARSAATTAGGSLAVIESASEQAFIESLLDDGNAASGSYWFGLQESSTEGDYRPISGNSTYTNFGLGEPNNGVGLDESVGGIYWTASSSESTFARRGEWNDLPLDGFPLGPGGSPVPDLPRGGYLIEFDSPIGSPGGGDGGGGGNPIPIPAAALAFPATALLAYGAARRMRRPTI